MKKYYINVPIVTISSCVFEHILSTKDLTHIEKLFYIAADSLSLINKNKDKYRAVALPSKEWASILQTNKSLIFIMQKTLEIKGYFIVKKTFDKFGRNNRNLIIPTLPESVFNRLKNIYQNVLKYWKNLISLKQKKSTKMILNFI